MSDEIRSVIEAQRRWAERGGFPVGPSGDRLLNETDALVMPLLPAVRESLAAGKGNELTRIPSLRSSSCLAINVFQPWHQDPSSIASVLGAEGALDEMQFEATQPTGLRGVPPHLDVLITGEGPAIGVESKFLEMYEPTSNTFEDSYFDDLQLWGDLSKSRDLALAVARAEVEFVWLGAAQLLKHALGLSRNQPSGFQLVLAWYRVDGDIADQIDSEIGRFAAAVDFPFQAMTYQHLVPRLPRAAEPLPGYFDYLADRYLL